MEATAIGLALVVAFVVTGALLRVVDVDPVKAFVSLFKGAFGTREAILETLLRSAPLMLTASATVLVFQGRIWSIGQEGQLLGGAMMSYWALLTFGDLPRIPLLVIIVVAGFAGGALLGLMAGTMRAYFNVDVIVSTVMLNYIVTLVLSTLIYDRDLWMDPDYYYPRSAMIPEIARFPVLIEGYRLHMGVILALLAALLVGWILRRTPLGYDIRALGANPTASLYRGINTAKVLMLTIALSGGIAGLAGTGEVFGVHDRLTLGISPGYGYTGIIVAMLADLNAVAVVPAAVLFGALINGSMNLLVMTGVPTAFIYALQAITLILLLVARIGARYRIRRRVDAV